MEKTTKILRRSIFAFLQNYQYFTTIAVVLAFPFAASSLLAQSFVPSSSLLPVIQRRLSALFDAAGFPASSQLFTILNLKLSQTIVAFFLVCPFTLSFLLFAKAAIFQALCNYKPVSQPPIASVLSAYEPLFTTQICNFLLVLSANGTCFSILFFAFNVMDALGLSNPKSILFLSAAGAILYSVILVYSLIVCNLALALSGTEKSSGYIAILKAFVLLKGRTTTALSLVLSVNMALAAVELLFQYRVVGAYLHADTPTLFIALEGLLIAYIYAIFLVLETIISCLFLKSCKSVSKIDEAGEYGFGSSKIMDLALLYNSIIQYMCELAKHVDEGVISRHKIEAAEKDGDSLLRKLLEDIP